MHTQQHVELNKRSTGKEKKKANSETDAKAKVLVCVVEKVRNQEVAQRSCWSLSCCLTCCLV